MYPSQILSFECENIEKKSTYSPTYQDLNIHNIYVKNESEEIIKEQTSILLNVTTSNTLVEFESAEEENQVLAPIIHVQKGFPITFEILVNYLKIEIDEKHQKIRNYIFSSPYQIMKQGNIIEVVTQAKPDGLQA